MQFPVPGGGRRAASVAHVSISCSASRIWISPWARRYSALRSSALSTTTRQRSRKWARVRLSGDTEESMPHRWGAWPRLEGGGEGGLTPRGGGGNTCRPAGTSGGGEGGGGSLDHRPPSPRGQMAIFEGAWFSEVISWNVVTSLLQNPLYALRSPHPPPPSTYRGPASECYPCHPGVRSPRTMSSLHGPR